MRPFEYVSASGRNQVGELLGTKWEDAEILAGGTDLVSLMKDEIVTPKRLVNIKGIADLHGVGSMRRRACESGRWQRCPRLHTTKRLQSNFR